MHKENAHQVSELHEILSEYLLAADSSNCSLIRTLKIDMNYGKTYQVFPILSGHARTLIGLLTLLIDTLNNKNALQYINK